jgi:boron transporter
VLSQLGSVSGTQIAYALVPALIITLLFYFDHNVSSQLAQQKDFQLVRLPAYHWDLLVLSALTVRSPRHHCVWNAVTAYLLAIVLKQRM